MSSYLRTATSIAHMALDDFSHFLFLSLFWKTCRHNTCSLSLGWAGLDSFEISTAVLWSWGTDQMGWKDKPILQNGSLGKELTVCIFSRDNKHCTGFGYWDRALGWRTITSHARVIFFSAMIVETSRQSVSVILDCIQLPWSSDVATARRRCGLKRVFCRTKRQITPKGMYDLVQALRNMKRTA